MIKKASELAQASLADKVEAISTGRISQIIASLLSIHSAKSLAALTEAQKLTALCEGLDFTPAQLDDLIADNSPVLRTIRGHAFELFFDHLLAQSGYTSEKRGGDTDIDRVVNGHTLQLKTPTQSGTSGDVVQFKTHKTHGAKSEQESLGYYHDADSFADFLVGLISYRPLKIIFIPRKDLPRHGKSGEKILSPFSVNWAKHPGLNTFSLIGAKKVDLEAANKMLDYVESTLPKSSKILGLPSGVIIDTIVQEENFRIWDMNIRGFSREHAFRYYLASAQIDALVPSHCSRTRADKADLALMQKGREACRHFQVKGITLGACHLEAEVPLIGIETQLSRGRANDHPTQSRLYLKTDFDELILCLEPPITTLLNRGKTKKSSWEFYAISVEKLKEHGKFPRRLKSLQILRYSDLQRYRIDASWLSKWRTR